MPADQEENRDSSENRVLRIAYIMRQNIMRQNRLHSLRDEGEHRCRLLYDVGYNDKSPHSNPLPEGEG